MNCWEILGISKDSDKATIKRAYAKLLKIHNPEDDAEGYQKLRQAYDQALKYEKTHKQEDLFDFENDFASNRDSDSNNDNSDDYNTEFSKKPFHADIYEEEEYDDDIKRTKPINLYDEEDSEEPLDAEIDEFLNRIYEIYSDKSLRDDKEAWQSLLDMPAMWNVNNIHIMQDEVLKFILEHKFVSYDILKFLDTSFEWSKNEIDLYKKYDNKDLDMIFKVIKDPNKFSYRYLEEIPKEKLDQYLNYRENAYKFLMKLNFSKLEENIFGAYEIYKNDPQLLSIIANYYVADAKMNEALNYFKQALSIDNNDLESVLRIGSILTYEQKFAEAIPYLERYVSFVENEYQYVPLNNLMFCYYNTERYLKAKEVLRKLIYLKPQTKWIKKYLENVEAKIAGKNVKTLKFKKPKLKSRRSADKNIGKKKTKNTKVSVILIIITVAIALALQTWSQDRKKPNVDNNIKSTQEKNSNGKFDRYLRDVTPIDYYKVDGVYDSKGKKKKIVSKQEIDEKAIWDQVQSQVFLGTFEGSAVLFTDSNCSKDTIAQDGKYKVTGKLSDMDADVFSSIKEAYNSYNFDNKAVGQNLYIAVQDDEEKQIITHRKDNNKNVKYITNDTDYENLDYWSVCSVYLKDIVVLDHYLVREVNEKGDGTLRVLLKDEVDKQNLWDKVEGQFYSGTINDIRVMFVDSNFSKEAIDSKGGYRVQGAVYGVTGAKFQNAKCAPGQEVYSVKVLQMFIYV
jgi:Tfp pilus assembly protein PilF